MIEIMVVQVRIFYLKLHSFLGRVQSPTWTTNKKFLQESITAMLTPKSGNYVL